MRNDIARKELPAYISDLAVRAFYQRGIAGIGMEEIAARAQVSKRTLYRHFPGKLELVERGLRARSDRWFSRLERETDPLLLFDLLTEDAGDLGCVFVNATAQTAAFDPRIREVARWHKARLLDLVRSRVSTAGDPERLARRIMLLVEGALASAAVAGSVEPVPLPVNSLPNSYPRSADDHPARRLRVDARRRRADSRVCRRDIDSRDVGG